MHEKLHINFIYNIKLKEKNFIVLNISNTINQFYKIIM